MNEKIIYTLSKLSIRGKDSLHACVACMQALSDTAPCGENVLRSVLAEMENITVSGADASRLLGCMQAVEQLIEEVEHSEAHDKQGEHP